MPSTPKEHRQRLAEQVRLRRTQLGKTKVDVARDADLNINTYNQVEAGQSVRDNTYGKIEPALGWAAGSCQEILRGGSPTTIEPGPDGSVISPVQPDDLKDAVGRAVQDAAVATTDLPAPEIRKLKQQVLEELERQGKLR
ncbi:helix-turn-helix domain-containing protein [Streptomyces sp. AA1529]|uniref:helix-turn-helix domain-containing protein n=1 Tax=Streptomyces sp. AA1529 TaxID=1203257 RepID=UPI000374EBE2|nr:helix-turn-helix transcriptional regulator [Streptomyces sp. AA1529]